MTTALGHEPSARRPFWRDVLALRPSPDRERELQVRGFFALALAAAFVAQISLVGVPLGTAIVLTGAGAIVLAVIAARRRRLGEPIWEREGRA